MMPRISLSEWSRGRCLRRERERRGRAQVVLVKDVGEIEHEARARVFVGSLLREEDCAIDPGAWRNDEFGFFARDVFAVFAQRIRDGTFDRITGARTVAVNGSAEANAEGEAGRQI